MLRIEHLGDQSHLHLEVAGHPLTALVDAHTPIDAGARCISRWPRRFASMERGDGFGPEPKKMETMDSELTRRLIETVAQRLIAAERS